LTWNIGDRAQGWDFRAESLSGHLGAELLTGGLEADGRTQENFGIFVFEIYFQSPKSGDERYLVMPRKSTTSFSDSAKVNF
jgi:hypothetical protein